MKAKKKLDPRLVPYAAEVLKTLGHPLRLRLLEALADGEKSVGQLQKDLEVPQAVVSQHLRVMKTGQVVLSCRRGTLVFYYLANPGLVNLLGCIHSCQDHCLANLSQDRLSGK